MSVVSLPLSAGEDTLELHSVDLELEAVEKQIRDLQVKLARLQQWKATLESSRTDAHLSQVNSHMTQILRQPQPRVFLCPGPTHQGRSPSRFPSPRRRDTTEPGYSNRTLDEDLSLSAATCLQDLDPKPLLRQTKILKKDFRSLVEKVRSTRQGSSYLDRLPHFSE